MTVGQMRGAVVAFLALAIAISANTLFMQNDPTAVAAAKARAQRAAAKAELLRAKRLSLGGVDRNGVRRRAERRANSTALRSKPMKTATSRTAKGVKTVLRRGQQHQSAAVFARGLNRRVSRPSSQRELVRAIQRELAQRGYEPGLADGLPGLITRAAIMAYQHDNESELTGLASKNLLRGIVQGRPSTRETVRRPLPAGVKPQVERVIRTVQQSLSTMGYNPGTIDGMVGEETVRAIREFEMDHNLVVTGRVSGHLVAQLARIATGSRVATKRK